MTKIKVNSGSQVTDFVTPKKRKTKKQPQVDFNLADNDDFFGFSSESMKLSKFEKTMYLIVAGLVIVYISHLLFV